MQVTTVSDFRENAKKYMDDCWENAQAVIIARPKQRNVVMLSMEMFEKMRKDLKQHLPPERAQLLDMQF